MNIFRTDKILLISIFLGLAFCLYGIHWGWVSSFNPDQMALKPLGGQGKLPFQPQNYKKPPFHTYYNAVFSTIPIKVIQSAFGLSSQTMAPVRLIWSRILVVLLFIGSILLVYQITYRFFGFFPARIIAVLYATSAGFIHHSHFLTADIPLVFWMLLAFYFSQNILINRKMKDYILAGLFTGVATAVKYNGLAVGIALPVAHCLSLDTLTWRKILFDRKIYLGLTMVAVGFLVSNPFAILDYRNFTADFVYNYIVAQTYGEAVSGTGYWKFFMGMKGLVGWPAFVVFFAASLYSLSLLFLSRSVPKKGLILLLAIFLLYYLKFGGFPRLPDRFVMPVVAFWLIFSGPFWNRLKPYRFVLSGLLAILVGYNLYCSFYVGKIFSEDPRMRAIEWVKRHVPAGSSIESFSYVPRWDMISGVDVSYSRLPIVSGRARHFKDFYDHNDWVERAMRKHETSDAIERLYSMEQLLKRKPDFITVNSFIFRKFTDDSPGEYYPAIKAYFTDLLNERYPYKIVFDQESRPPNQWIYPYTRFFVFNRMVILQRQG